MLKIRLQRVGRINTPAYRVVVTEHARAAQSANFVEKLGSYNPKTKERILNVERIKHWISVGAKPSDTMHNMLISAGIIEGKKINVLPKKTVAASAEDSGVAKEEPATENAPATETAPATSVEAPAETTTEETALVEETPAK